jgi:hypothetical protein
MMMPTKIASDAGFSTPNDFSGGVRCWGSPGRGRVEGSELIQYVSQLSLVTTFGFSVGRKQFDSPLFAPLPTKSV